MPYAPCALQINREAVFDKQPNKILNDLTWTTAMKRNFPFSFEFLYQLFSLIIIVIVVHAVYVAAIRPRADAILAKQAIQLAEDKSQVMQRSVFVLIRDYEQEACFILMFWAIAIMGFKGLKSVRQRALLQMDLIPLAEGERILPEDTRDVSRQIQALPPHQREALLPRALLAGLQRFSTTRNIQDVASATHAYCDSEAERLESELSMIRYIAWAIPSIGFIGTVRGIGDALGYAHKAIEGDIFDVTRSLGVAFNSTLIALLISIGLMFLLHQLQQLQERYVLDATSYCDENLISHLYTR
jgi:biopolymer transport protein ExbB/TolQ